ncbi:hypothetical protein ACFXCZ_19880 [Streptomyces sp. NPDC059396]|uniref:hypothetical protein n=1 Tax=Streptomyces sp. NPDC059396 TaxID=3346819 RepID=UPI0036C6A47F
MPTADELISPDSIEKLARVLGTTAGPASRWSAVRESAGALGPLALSERARAVRDALIHDLPGSGTYAAALP